MSEPILKAVHLGGYGIVASLRYQPKVDPTGEYRTGGRAESASLAILVSSGTEEDSGYSPAESVTVHQVQNIKALRDLLNEVFPPDPPQFPPFTPLDY